jgi:uncharacterized membrane protein
MACIEVGAGAGYSALVQRNNSLTPATRLLAFGSIAAVCLAVACAFAVAGIWYVLPFAGIELGVLALAFAWTERHAGDYERITVRGDALEVETGGGGRVERRSFNRHWAQVVTNGGQLAVRERGREYAFGRLMTWQERAQVARALRGQVGRAGL